MNDYLNTGNEYLESVDENGELHLYWQDVDTSGKPTGAKHLLVKYSKDRTILKILPTRTSPTDPYPQFGNVKEIWIPAPIAPSSLEDITNHDNEFSSFQLLGSPEGFGHWFRYGLTIPKNYAGIFNEISELGQYRIVNMTGRTDTLTEDWAEIFTLPYNVFLEYMKSIERTINRTAAVRQKINHTSAYNVIAELTNTPKRKVFPGRTLAIKQITAAIDETTPLTEDQLSELASTVDVEAKSMAQKNPKEYKALIESMELVSLEVLIEKFEENLQKPNLNEKSWQKFFKNNDFILKQIFSMPVITYADEATLSPPTMSGGGTLITDFVFKNPLTDSMLILEMKLPSTQLMAASDYRGKDKHASDIYPTSRDLSGSVAQIYAQIASAKEHFRSIAYNSPNSTSIETSTLSGALMIGSLKNLTDRQRISFNHYRNSLHGVQIVTYDEVLSGIKSLHEMLNHTKTS